MGLGGKRSLVSVISVRKCKIFINCIVIWRKSSESSHVSDFCKGSAILLYKLSIHFQLFSSLELVILHGFVIINMITTETQLYHVRTPATLAIANPEERGVDWKAELWW